MRYETVELHIDDSAIANGSISTALEPVWWIANIYDGPEEYEFSLLPFSRSQRLIFAMTWYFNEVNNGGHHQFYSNSTGIVWKDALDALRAMELLEFAKILEESVALMGGTPSLEREERREFLAESAPRFDVLDRAFYELQEKIDVDARTLEFIRSRPSEFLFEGKITKAVLPGR
jgi:hypothetical protein